jgi:hypothetical protein
LYTTTGFGSPGQPLPLYISFRVSDIYLMMADVGSRNMLQCMNNAIKTIVLGLYVVSQYISNKMQRYTVYLYLETALRVLGGTTTHHQERIELYLQHLVFVTPLLLSAATN